MHICDILTEEHVIPTLKNWALLCSQLTSHCQIHVFADIVLAQAYRSPLSKILQVHAELVEHINRLCLTACSTAYFADADLCSVLPRCTKVSAFELSTRGLAFESLSDMKFRSWRRCLRPILGQNLHDGSEIPATTFFATAMTRLPIPSFQGRFSTYCRV